MVMRLIETRILPQVGWTSRIRSKLGVDEPYLPDADISQPDVIVTAEENIIDIVPDYAGLTGAKKTWLESATVCECAALLCPTLKARVPVREQGPHFTRDVSYDWDKRRDELETERDALLGKIEDIAYVRHFGKSGR